MKLLISACLLGICCRYDGASKPISGIESLAEKYNLVPICPEQLGGLATPRNPAERCGEYVLTRAGQDVTAQYQRGAQEALRIAQLTGCTCALLKAKSPSCGKGVIYDGTHTGTLIDGNGVAASLLLQNGIKVYTENELDQL